MRQHSSRSAARRRTAAAAVVGALALASLTACNGAAADGWLPRGVTDGAQRVTDLWVGMWIAAWAVGALVWGLIIFCMIRFRRRKGETGLPEQLRYNVPIEVLYTIVPIMMVGVIFFYTQRDESALLDVSKKPDVTVNVVGKQWSWDFNYVEAQVWDSGVQAQLTGKPGVQQTLPTLVLPENQRVEFVLTSRDVIHSFWVPAFQQKLDMVPGRVNRFQVVTREQGTFQGKCAELCGAYHATMLFNVKVVSNDEYQSYVNSLRQKGQTGMLDNSLSRAGLEPGQSVQQQYVPEAKASN